MTATDQPGFGSGYPPNPGYGASSGPGQPSSGYPVDLGLSSPDQIANWRPLVQWILALPHYLFLYVLGIASEVAMAIAWFAALFTGAVPDGIAGFLAGYYRYQWRVTSYAMFLREDYPAFALPMGYPDPGGDPAWLTITPPQGFNRMAVLFRVLLAIPQLIVLFFVGIGIFFAVAVAFFAVLFTGRWPEGLRSFVIRGMRWSHRFSAWFALLADPYPPFSLA